MEIGGAGRMVRDVRRVVLRSVRPARDRRPSAYGHRLTQRPYGLRVTTARRCELRGADIPHVECAEQAAGLAWAHGWLPQAGLFL